MAGVVTNGEAGLGRPFSPIPEIRRITFTGPFTNPDGRVSTALATLDENETVLGVELSKTWFAVSVFDTEIAVHSLATGLRRTLVDQGHDTTAIQTHISFPDSLQPEEA